MEEIVRPTRPVYNIKTVSKLSETIKNPRENIWIRVFHFDRLVTNKFSEEWEKKSLKPDTKISLITIINAAYTNNPLIFDCAIKIKIIETISILSAIGSRNLPKFDSISNFLAK